MSAENKLSPFSFIDSINAGYEHGKNLMDGVLVNSDDGLDRDSPDRQYSSFMVNRGLSQFNDTVLYANEMNMNYSLHPKMQYDFLRYSIRPRKRFSKWGKKIVEEVEVINALMLLYDYNQHRAEEAMSLLTEEQKKILVAKVAHGGVESKRKIK